MPQPTLAPPPQRLARLGGAIYLLLIVLGLFGQFMVRDRLVVAGDAMQTAANLRSHEMLWRANVATELVSLVAVTVLMLVWLAILRPVSRDLTWLALFFALTAHAAGAASALDLLATLFPLGDAPYLHAFTPEQLAALARLSIRTQAHGYGISLLLSGCFFLVAGPLIFRSGYLPRWIGVLYAIAGVGYVAHVFALVLAPSMADAIFSAAGPFILGGEGSLAVWLLVKGVDPAGWERRQRALAAA